MNINITLPVEAFPNSVPARPVELMTWLATTFPNLTVSQRIDQAEPMLHGRLMLTSERLGANARGRRFRFLYFSATAARDIRIHGGPMAGTLLPAYFRRRHGIQLAESAQCSAAYGLLPDGSEGYYPLELLDIIV
uniref:PAZ domain-containing protein n=1 Tax=Panagrellus redivivus TaxID=6233 RepID=A0A7E4V6I1_PANRE